MESSNIDLCQKAIGVEFKNKDLLETALTHKSYTKLSKNYQNNERLEFFGDAVLKFVISEYLFIKYPKKREGDLTKERSHIISDKALAIYANELELYKFVKVSPTEKKFKGNFRPALLADTLEAIIGAVYLDQGMETASKFIINSFKKWFAKIGDSDEFIDYKSKLQEYLQQQKHPLPQYDVIKEAGPDHSKEFHIEVTAALGKETLREVGKGLSKKDAERDAAKKLCDKFFSDTR